VTNPSDTSKYGSDPGGLWAAAEEDDFEHTKSIDDQRLWARAVGADFPADGDIVCDPRTFMPLDEFLEVSLGVAGVAPDLAQTALERAAERMMLVTAEGRELTWEEMEEYVMEADDPYSPNYISEPERRDEVTGLPNIDTAGERYTWMFRTFLRIVAEELRAAGAVPATIVPFPSSPIDYPTDAELAWAA
jgi:hypothetical protein